MGDRSRNSSEFAAEQLEWVIELIKKIGEIPTPTGDEVRRAEEVRRKLRRLGFSTQYDRTGNLWTAWPPLKKLEAGGEPLALFTSHLDCVFPWDIDWRVERNGNALRGPGVADNTTGVAALLALAKYVKETCPNPANQYVFAGTVGQVTDLRGIQALLDAIWATGLDPSKFCHVDVLGTPLGRVICGGVGTRRYEVRVSTTGGHSWLEAGAPNAIYEAARIIYKFYGTFRQSKKKATYNVGTIRGGTSINAVAPSATFTCEFRWRDPRELRKFIRKARELIQEAERDPRVHVNLKYTGLRPASPLRDDFPVVKLAQGVLRGLGVEPIVSFGSSDANYPLSVGLQSVALGCSKAHNTHTVNEWLEIDSLRVGLAQFFALFDDLERRFPLGRRKTEG
ncbi:MAG: M20/M25/M40 family metallo-hydrolase [Promethearchaeota archaeon]